MAAYLVLENGAVFKGEFFGVEAEICGEVVFTTGMTGYGETLTDPSYCGQIVVQTFPLIGNYGIIPVDFESTEIFARAYIVQEASSFPSNFRSEEDIGSFLQAKGIVGLKGVDTRSLTKLIREQGVMKGKVTNHVPNKSDVAEAKRYVSPYPIARVSPTRKQKTGKGPYRVGLMDFGAKKGIVDELVARGCEVISFPYKTSAYEILESCPQGIVLSNGPGDPSAAENASIVQEIYNLAQTRIPLFGICLGHQLLALAQGCTTHKLRFGHRGANQPVQELATGRVYITSQNHGYAVLADENNERYVSYKNNNDGSCEGMDWGNCFSVQFHPEARGGPQDTAFLFERFIERMDAYAAR